MVFFAQSVWNLGLPKAHIECLVFPADMSTDCRASPNGSETPQEESVLNATGCAEPTISSTCTFQASTQKKKKRKLVSLHSEIELLKGKNASLQEKIDRSETGFCKRKNASLQEKICRAQGSSHCCFAVEGECTVQGARAFDMDVCNRVLILARRLPSTGGYYVLTKISITKIGTRYPPLTENIQLPHGTKAVKDLCVCPWTGTLVLFASLGKKLSVLSMEGNNIVLTYDLPTPAWSCSWDLNSPHHVYTGLQNGKLLVFDVRQTATPMECIAGLSSRPIHTIHSLLCKSSTPVGVRTLLTASSAGPCIWNTGAVEARSPFRVPEMDNEIEDECISVAYCPSADDIVASFRPRVETLTNRMIITPGFDHRRIQGSHVHIKRAGGYFYHRLASSYVNVNDVGTLKSAIVSVENCRPLFAYVDKSTRVLSLCELPTLRATHSFQPHHHPILDVKYAASLGTGVLGSLSEDTVQLFSAKPCEKDR